MFLNSQRQKHLVVAQSYFSMNRQKKQRTADFALAIERLNNFVSIEVQNSNSVLRLKVSAALPAHRPFVNRYADLKTPPKTTNRI